MKELINDFFLMASTQHGADAVFFWGETSILVFGLVVTWGTLFGIFVSWLFTKIRKLITGK